MQWHHHQDENCRAHPAHCARHPIPQFTFSSVLTAEIHIDLTCLAIVQEPCTALQNSLGALPISPPCIAISDATVVAHNFTVTAAEGEPVTFLEKAKLDRH